MFGSYGVPQEPGHVGIINQGATCYMNSILQTLFHTPLFRTIVLSVPLTEEEQRTTRGTPTITNALKHLFFSMKNSTRSVSSAELTRSFGWDWRDSFHQHDSEEFLRVILDRLSTTLLKTPYSSTIECLLEGKLVTKLKCTNVPVQSLREEVFLDLSLPVQGHLNLLSALDSLIKPEILDGDNKYKTTDHGLQAATKCTEISSLPPVLHIHLMRWRYDERYGQIVKVNDKFEFPRVLDMRPYVTELSEEEQAILSKNKEEEETETKKRQTPSPTSSPPPPSSRLPSPFASLAESKQDFSNCRYLLHSVLVHSGGTHGGHYSCFVDEKLDGEWWEYNDAIARRTTEQQAMQNNFGGVNEDRTRFMNPWSMMMQNSSSAYFLVYIREQEAEKVVSDDEREKSPEEIEKEKQRMREERLALQRSIQEKEEKDKAALDEKWAQKQEERKEKDGKILRVGVNNGRGEGIDYVSIPSVEEMTVKKARKEALKMTESVTDQHILCLVPRSKLAGRMRVLSDDEIISRSELSYLAPVLTILGQPPLPPEDTEGLNNGKLEEKKIPLLFVKNAAAGQQAVVSDPTKCTFITIRNNQDSETITNFILSLLTPSNPTLTASSLFLLTSKQSYSLTKKFKASSVWSNTIAFLVDTTPKENETKDESGIRLG
ncbi:putative Ubiquitin carboxyl-terminal hydrolase 7 [Blattamonas nauphoetae]|uniref:Ubiquitin carboxyl-terminal hydrolase n=1 Tax=Blattamonas nauphoetae TaxID=2049346 RepID=A0ABQ9XPW1_9EUKA|nr:putative Ubiquitin carboxyl-terminal hydrolase 7 [Blattamonas nauphoetae]